MAMGRHSWHYSKNIPVEIVPDDPSFVPQYKSSGAAAADLLANLPNQDSLVISPGMTVVVDCGFSMALPPGWEAQVRPRSGLSKTLSVLNSPGTIDDDYRGRIQVILKNHTSDSSYILRHKERFAQMLLKPVWYFDWKIAEKLDETERGGGGFGSTGTK